MGNCQNPTCISISSPLNSCCNPCGTADPTSVCWVCRMSGCLKGGPWDYRCWNATDVNESVWNGNWDGLTWDWGSLQQICPGQQVSWQNQNCAKLQTLTDPKSVSAFNGYCKGGLPTWPDWTCTGSCCGGDFFSWMSRTFWGDLPVIGPSLKVLCWLVGDHPYLVVGAFIFGFGLLVTIIIPGILKSAVLG